MKGISMNTRTLQRRKRHKRIRTMIHGTEKTPRLSVYRSNTGLYVQLIDDTKRTTVLGLRSSGKSIQAATALGTTFAQEAKKKKVTTIVFDRGGNLYHGKVKAFADAAREGGLTF
jgi:large subunit ribosomal protein L18